MKTLKVRLIAATFLSMLMIFVFSSCRKDNGQSVPNSTVVKGAMEFDKQMLPFPEIPGDVVKLKNKHTGEMFSFLKKDDKYIIGSHAVLTRKQVDQLLNRNPKERASFNQNISLWPEKTIYYKFKPDFSDDSRKAVKMAMDAWTQHTGYGINFSEATPAMVNYVLFYQMDANACWSYLGMTGGAQDFGVGIDCTPGDIMNCLGTTIGLYPEHKRLDRDDYVTVHFENIHPYDAPLFQKISEPLGPFDFNSIMMEDSWYFAETGPSMTKKADGSTFVVQRVAPSELDVIAFFQLYDTNKKYVKLEKVITYEYAPSSGPTLGTRILKGHYNLHFFADQACTIPLSLERPMHIKVKNTQDEDHKINEKTEFVKLEAGSSTYMVGTFEDSKVYYMGALDNYRKWTSEILPLIGYITQ